MKNNLNVDQIKKLWLLDLIVSSGSLKNAAARAKISPSAVSQSLSALEKNVGKPLVIRQKGSVQATQEALEILNAVRPAFAVFDNLQALGSQPVPQMTWLNFGAFESISVNLLPGLIHSLRGKMPKLKLGLRIGRSEDLLKRVRKGELCSAIVTECEGLENFYKVKVCDDRLGIFVSRRLGTVTWAELENLSLGSLSPGTNGHPRYYSKFLRHLGAIKPSVLSESFETLRSATAAGAIASILPQRVALRSDELEEVVAPTVDAKSGTHSIFVVSQTNCDRVEADFLAEEARRILV